MNLILLKMHKTPLGNVKHTKTDFIINLQVVAVKCKHVLHKFQVNYREQALPASCAQLWAN